MIYTWSNPEQLSPISVTGTVNASVAETLGVDPISRLADAINNLVDALRPDRDD